MTMQRVPWLYPHRGGGHGLWGIKQENLPRWSGTCLDVHLVSRICQDMKPNGSSEMEMGVCNGLSVS
jgi:hypothetical protein